MCVIISLMKQLLIKLGWLKESHAIDGCGLPAAEGNYYQQGQGNERPAGGSPFGVFFR